MKPAAVDEKNIAGDSVPRGFIDCHMERAAYDTNQFQFFVPVVGHGILRMAFRDVVEARRKVCGSVLFYFFVFYIMHIQNHQF